MADRDAADDDGLTWLTVDSRRLTFREYRRLAPGWAAFLVASVLKLLRRRLGFGAALTREFRWIDRADSVPDWAATGFAADEPALLAAGLAPVGTYTVPMLGRTVTVGRVFLDRDGLLVAQLMVSRTEGVDAPARVVTSCTSRGADDAVIATGNHAAHLDHGPTVRGELVRDDAAAVVRRHRARIATMAIVPCPADRVRDRLADEHARSVAFHERRRVYVPVAPAELAALRAATPPDALPAATVVRGPARPPGV